jgi:hypothetical protein
LLQDVECERVVAPEILDQGVDEWIRLRLLHWKASLVPAPRGVQGSDCPTIGDIFVRGLTGKEVSLFVER